MRFPARAVPVVLAVALALAGCSGGGLGNPVGNGGNDQGFVDGSGVTELTPGERGDPIELSGQTLGGTELDLASLRGKVVVVNVWASWCPPCRAEAPGLASLAGQMSADDVAFTGINTRDNDAAAKTFVDNYSLDYPQWVDGDNTALLLQFHGQVNPQTLPTTLVLDREGRIAARALGQVRESTLQALVQTVLEET